MKCIKTKGQITSLENVQSVEVTSSNSIRVVYTDGYVHPTAHVFLHREANICHIQDVNTVMDSIIKILREKA